MASFTTAVYCAIRLGIDVIYYEYVEDALLMGCAALSLMLIAFGKKKRRWFSLSAVFLLFLEIYMSKEYWFDLAWRVYLLTAGSLLISIATANEWRCKHKTTLSKRLLRFMEDWEW